MRSVRRVGVFVGSSSTLVDIRRKLSGDCGNNLEGDENKRQREEKQEQASIPLQAWPKTSRGCHFETRTVCDMLCTPKYALSHCADAPFESGWSRARSRSAPGGSSSASNFLLGAGVHDLVKTNFAKKGSSVSSQPRQPKTSPPRTTKPVDSAPARTRILFSPPTAHSTVWQLALSDLSPARLQPRHASVNIELRLRCRRPEPRLERKRTQ